MKKKLGLFILIFILLLCACGSVSDNGSTQQSEGLKIYYLNKDETALVSCPYETTTTEQTELLAELIGKMKAIPEDADQKAPLHMGFEVERCYVEGTQVVVSVNEHYRELTPTTEVLVRAAIVRTLTQVEGIDCVSMLIGSDPLVDSTGNPVGAMTADTFIDNEGTEINGYEQTTIRLYFANESGDSLVEISQPVIYNSNISMEKLVVEQLILGPNNSDSYPTVNPQTKIIAVTITDGVCYVNLSEDFLEQPYNVSSAVTIYSIVNSLVELSNVNKVQILIEGESEIMYRENMSLDTIFTRNLDLVVTQ